MFLSGLWYTLVKSFDFGLNCYEKKKDLFEISKIHTKIVMILLR